MKKANNKTTAYKSKPAAKSKSAPKKEAKAPAKKAAVKKPVATLRQAQRPVKSATKVLKPASKLVPSSKQKGNSKVSKQAPTRTRMNKEELKYFEHLLNEKKETLIQELDYLEDNTMRLNAKDGAGDLSSHAYHLARRLSY